MARSEFPNMDRRAGGLLSISFFITSYTKQFTTRFSTFTCGDFGMDDGGVPFMFLVVDSTQFTSAAKRVFEVSGFTVQLTGPI